MNVSSSSGLKRSELSIRDRPDTQTIVLIPCVLVLVYTWRTLGNVSSTSGLKRSELSIRDRPDTGP